MADGLLTGRPLDDPDYDYGMLLPFRARKDIDVDGLSTDGVELAFPQVVRDPFNAMIEMGQAMQGQRNLGPGDVFFNMMDVSPASSIGSAPANALGSMMLRRQADAPAGGSTTSMYDVPAGSKPEYLGAAPDRTELSFLRYTPKKETARVQSALQALSDTSNPVRKQMISDIQEGLKLGGGDWYNTEELRDWFMKELGPERGHTEWNEFMDLMGAASPGSKVPANIKNASAIRQRMANDPDYQQGLMDAEKLPDALELARGRLPGYGHKTQGNQELNVARQAQGRWRGDPEPGVAATKGSLVENPKPKGFAQSLKGSERNIAADLHFTRYMAMASGDAAWLTTQAQVGKDLQERLLALGPKKMKPYFGSRMVDGKEVITFNPKKAVKDGKVSAEDLAKLDAPNLWAEKPNDSEYAAFERFIYNLGQQLDLTGPQVQAALWMGAAQRTGVDPTSQGTFMELFRRRADQKAASEGMTREEVIRRFIKDKGLLSQPGLPGGGLLPKSEEQGPGGVDLFGLYSGGVI